tara:strand:+ start:3535 stop:3708 length:174 start_codon:yes stop_codon:yes gene_type:complete
MEMYDEIKPKAFAFLDNLRESGITNMFGATPYLVDEFDIDKKAAAVLLMAWMQQYGK